MIVVLFIIMFVWLLCLWIELVSGSLGVWIICIWFRVMVGDFFVRGFLSLSSMIFWSWLIVVVEWLERSG